ncbi:MULTISPECIES: PTS glucitol/sorbitol transporter subunit IIC [Niallia]|uniref:PTS glucitol/sorbitol transporter subunit IIC n=1 Tax=Niallia TaxID=2837506 RepID=UPI000312ED8D|nr:PTS glucitol/sorbitol transporter subunit IIC [Niallia circulans]AYV72668.1 PTS sorbitol transporter subunit IIC [Niallia circulans]NRG29394.1 PTS sorbitol transporter subunit IIC [Niallia circulans]QJX60427.1 PTS sorbitol transporter subunit IIC [Niallia circulans]
MSFVVDFAEKFMGFFEFVGDVFVGMFTGIVPILVGMLTLIQFIVNIVGEKRIERVGQFLAKSSLLKYSIFPIFAGFFLGNPASITLGRFLPEKSKPGLMEAMFRNGHPLTSLFPHTNPAELFVWLGVAQGIEQLGLPVGALAIRYIITGIIVGIISGIITELIFTIIAKRNNYEIDSTVNFINNEKGTISDKT